MTDVAVAFITAGGSIIVGVLTLIGVIVTTSKSNKKIENNLAIAQAVTDTKIEELTREVREHNNFARRMPVVEQSIIDIKDDVNHLKKYHEEKV